MLPPAPVQAHQAKNLAEGVDVRSGIFRVAAGAGDSAPRSGVGASGMIGLRELQMAVVAALERVRRPRQRSYPISGFFLRPISTSTAPITPNTAKVGALRTHCETCSHASFPA